MERKVDPNHGSERVPVVRPGARLCTVIQGLCVEPQPSSRRRDDKKGCLFPVAGAGIKPLFASSEARRKEKKNTRREF